MLPPSYLEDGHLTYAYAMTVHKSQAMTASRTYVLGSADLYAELGYTALSRHQDSCRIYLNAGGASDQLELDVASDQRDETLTRIERTLGRSRAQEMALDVHETDQDLSRLPDIELAERAGGLGELLASYPAVAREAERRTADLQRGAEEIRRHEQRLTASRAERETLGTLQRSKRSRLDERIARQEEVTARAQASYDTLSEQAAVAREAGDQWLEEHGVELAEATVIERELTQRRRARLEDAVVRAAHDPDEGFARQLGPRPESFVGRQEWDAAAAALAGYQETYGELSDVEPPLDGRRRRMWDRGRSLGQLPGVRDPVPQTPVREVDSYGPELER